MTNYVSLTFGIVAGLVLSLAITLIAVLATNGKEIPGIGMPSTASAAGGASASGEVPLPGTNGSFGSLDLNSDGRLTLAEAAGHADIVTRFQRADRNKDGRLTKAEFARLEKLPVPKERPKPRLRLREDAAASLASAPREGQ